MFSAREWILGFAMPAVFAGVILVVAAIVRREGVPRWVTPIAVGFAFAAGYFGVGKVKWPPQNRPDWVAFAAPVVALVGAAISLKRVPWWVAALVALIAGGGIV